MLVRALRSRRVSEVGRRRTLSINVPVRLPWSGGVSTWAVCRCSDDLPAPWVAMKAVPEAAMAREAVRGRLLAATGIDLRCTSGERDERFRSPPP